ncbi:MAG: ATP-NAD kinase [Halalkalicoccus sp.]
MGSIAGGPPMTVAVVGAAESVLETLEAAGYAAQAASPETAGRAEPEAIVTVGERALLAVVRERPDAAILALNTDIGPAADDHAAIVDALAGGAEHERPLLSVAVGGEPVGRAFMDVALVTSEPARISEYAVDHDDERVAAFRADGVVVATPAGSRGYAGAAGGPTLAASADALSVVPIAPFHTQSARWILDTSPLTLSVLRDEGAVSLLIDDTEYGSVGPDQRVRLARHGTIRTLRPR